MDQRDTYYAVPRGRLKLRQITPLNGGEPSAEVIAYHRLDTAGNRWSSYRRVPLSPDTAGNLAQALASTIGVVVVVEKRRRVAVRHRTRIHLDTVVGLGEFFELETVLDRPQDAEQRDAHSELEETLSWLGLDAQPPIAGSYCDLLLARGTTGDSSPQT